jgi:hypothetical protein
LAGWKDRPQGQLPIEQSMGQPTNRKLNINNTCGFKGVFRRGEKFRSYVNKDGKRHNIGTFDTAEEAHAAYLAKAKELHGEFARSE